MMIRVYFYLFNFIVLSALSIPGIAQNVPNNGVKQYRFRVEGNASDWQYTGIKLKKGESVLFQTSGKVNYGFWIGQADATGFLDFSLLIKYNRPEFISFNHGILICRNGNGFILPHSSLPILIAQNEQRIHIPDYFLPIISKTDFTGNFFISAEDQELKFILNDKKYTDNSGFFDVTAYVLPACPDLNGLYDLADLLDRSNGSLDFCIKDNCGSLLNNDGSFWAGGVNNLGHYYLAINPLDNNTMDASASVNLLFKNIYDVFPGRAVDVISQANPRQSSIILNHYYDLVDIVSPLNPRVKVVKISKNYFTFEATGSHIFKGTATHGIFRDKCGELYMFQQGRGMPEEYKLQGNGNLVAARSMWRTMAENMKAFLH